jgi:hypothetical protein
MIFLNADTKQFVRASARTKRKGLQLALEPLNGRDIAGYVPRTVVVGAAPRGGRAREETYML